MNKLRCLVIFFLISAFLLPNNVKAEDTSYTDERIKAAYILKIIQFVTFPSNKKDICIIQNDYIGIYLSNIQESYNLKENIQKKSLASNLNECKLIFFGNIEPSKLKRKLENIDANTALTVGDAKGFIDMGGVIGFTDIDGSIKLEINTIAALHQNIEMSSNLLEIAQRVIHE